MSTSTGRLAGHRVVFLGALVFTLLSAAVAVTAWLDLQNDNENVLRMSREAASKSVKETVRLIEHRVENLKVAERLAAELSDSNRASAALLIDNLDARILEEVAGDDDIAITVAWLPEYIPDNFQSEHFEASPDAVIYFKLGFKIGDTKKIHDGSYSRDQVENQQKGDITVWYRKAIREQRPVWFSSAYYSPFSDTWWAGGYSVPIIIDGKVAGVVAAELTVEQANTAMIEAEAEGFKHTPIDSNFGMLVSDSGTIFSHPDLKVVEEHNQINHYVPELTTPAETRTLYPLAETFTKDDEPAEIYVLDNFENTRTGQTLSLFFAPINETGWWTVVVLDQNAINRGIDNILRIKSGTIRLFIAVLALVFGLSLLLLRVDRGQETRLWAAAFVFSLMCVAGISGVLYYGLKQGEHVQPGEVLLKNRAITAKAVMKYQQDSDQLAITVPTGIFVQSAEFSSANDVTITGFIWQKYNQDMPQWLQRGPDDTEPGFIFPEAEQIDVEFRYRRAAGDDWVYGWYFTAVLRQEFDYKKYPFDLENAWVRIWHSEIGRGVILTPDLTSYSTLVPAKLPAMELQDFVLEGWDIAGTYFSYRHSNYNTTFGIDDYRGGDKFPELYFNIALTRAFLNAFIMNFITITVVAFLLFAVLYTIRTDKTDIELLGFNVSAVLGFCAALFFVVILAHTSLRETLAAQSLVYLEYYFFVMYVAFIGVSVNAIMVASATRHRWLQLGDNLIARLMYWPVLSFSLLLVTLVIF